MIDRDNAKEMTFGIDPQEAMIVVNTSRSCCLSAEKRENCHNCHGCTNTAIPQCYDKSWGQDRFGFVSIT